MKLTTSKNREHIKKYYDKRSACQVLGSLMLNPKLINSKEYPIEIDDFVTPNHKALFGSIYNLSQQGVASIGLNDIESYMHNYKPLDHIKMFEKNDSSEWINKLIEDANTYNYDYYYTNLKKLAILRSYIEMGFNVADILDVNEMDTIIYGQQLENFEMLTVNDIISYFDRKNLKAKKRFIVDKEGARRKAGDDAEELRERMKESPTYGYGLESQYLNSITRGALPCKFILETRDTGMGKTRVAIKRLLYITAPEIWSYEKNQFIKNPNGVNNSALYIGTEMELYEELEPMMWAFISGVEEDRIKDNDLTSEEEKRVDKAMEILSRTRLFLEDESNYDLAFLWGKAEEYKIEHNICAMAIDYLELTNGLTAEYVQQTRGMSAREDQVLLNLSKNIKEICNKFKMTIFGFTQTTDEARREGVRDQRAVKGARSIPNKADVGIVTFEPTKKELQMLEPVIQKYARGKVKHKTPNVCYSFYKNRGGKIKEARVWGWQNLGNMEYYDLFCTNKYYEPIDIKPIFIEVKE